MDLLEVHRHIETTLQHEPDLMKQVESLFQRGFLMALQVDKWRSTSIYPTTPGRDDYPHRAFHDQPQPPPVLYYCGHPKLARDPKVPVLSNSSHEERLQAQLRINQGLPLVNIVEEPLRKTCLQRDRRDAIIDGNLLLISQHDPGLGRYHN